MPHSLPRASICRLFLQSDPIKTKIKTEGFLAMRGNLTALSHVDRQTADAAVNGHFKLCDAHTQKQLSAPCHTGSTVPPLSRFIASYHQMWLFSTATCHHSDHGYSPTHFYSANTSTNLVRSFRPAPFPESKSTVKQPLPTTVDRVPEDLVPAMQTPWQAHHRSTRQPLSRPGSRPQPLRLRSNPERFRPTIGHLWQRMAQAPSR